MSGVLFCKRDEGRFVKSRAFGAAVRRCLIVAAKVLTLRYSRAFAEWKSRRPGPVPVTYSEKLRYRMAWDTNPLLTTFANKIAVRDYVATVAGSQFLTHVYAICSRADEVKWTELPREYVCKVNHGSGGVIVVTEAADRSVQLPRATSSLGWARFAIHPDNADPIRLEALLSYWLGLNYYWQPGSGVVERAYRDVKRGILVEELLPGEAGGPPDDYKLTVVAGRVRLVERLIRPSFGGAYVAGFFDREGVPLPIRWQHHGVFCKWSDSMPLGTESLDDLVEFAETLGSGVDAIRVDLYSIRGRTVFGELTNYPTAGKGAYLPHSFEVELGSDWHPSYGPHAH